MWISNAGEHISCTDQFSSSQSFCIQNANPWNPQVRNVNPPSNKTDGHLVQVSILIQRHSEFFRLQFCQVPCICFSLVSSKGEGLTVYCFERPERDEHQEGSGLSCSDVPTAYLACGVCSLFLQGEIRELEMNANADVIRCHRKERHVKPESIQDKKEDVLFHGRCWWGAGGGEH